MPTGPSFDIYQYVYDGFDTLLNDYVLDTAQRISTTLTPVAYTMLCIYFVLWGFSMVRGLIREPVTDGLMRMVRIAIVLGIALGVGNYSTYVVDFFMQTPDAMAAVIALDGTAEATSIGRTADSLVDRTINTATEIWNQAGIMNGNWGHYFVAFIVVFAGLTISAVAFLIFMFSKIGLVFLLALGPMFVLMAMFKQTMPFFEGWLKQLVTYMLTMIFVLAAVNFIFSMVSAVVDRVTPMMLSDYLLQGMVQLSAIGVCGVVVLLNVKSMATGIAGGLNMAMSGPLRQMMMGGGVGRVARIGLGAVTGGVATGVMAVKGVSLAARSVGNLARASNSIRSG